MVLIAQCVVRAGPLALAVVAASMSACQTHAPIARMSAEKFFGSDHSECKMSKVGEMPVSASDGHLYIDGIVNRQHVSFVFDTGVQETTLTQAATSRLKLTAVPGKTGIIAGIGGEVPVSLYRVHFLLNGVDGDWERYVLGGDLNGSGNGIVRDGLIGPSFFTGHDIDLDLPDNKIILYFPEHDCSHPSAFLHGSLTNVPLVHPEYAVPDKASADTKRIAAFIANLLSASPKILVSASGKLLVAAVDSGAPRNTLFLEGARKIGVAEGEIAKDKHTLAFGLGPHAVAAAEHILAAVDIGELEVLNMPVDIVDQDTPVGIDMILGLDFIQRVHLWISYSSNSLIMQYPPSPSPLYGVPH
jgi:predicted aspartyl protease